MSKLDLKELLLLRQIVQKYWEAEPRNIGLFLEMNELEFDPVEKDEK